MKKFISAIFSVVVLSFVMISCVGGTDVVESGTYQGKIDEVEPEKTEIYVETVDGKRLELYFTESTILTRNGDTTEFSALKEGMNVEVKVEKTGKRLDPLSVKILD